MPAVFSVQVLLTAVIITLTGLLVFIGVQVIFILREVHKAAKDLSKKNESPSLLTQLRQTLNANSDQETPVRPEVIPIPIIQEEEENYNYPLPLQKEDVEEPIPQNSYPHITALQERGRRVFHREGKPLA